MMKRKIWLVSLCILIGVISWGFYAMNNFSFSHYRSHQAMAEAFKEKFPIGTPRAEVEKLLVKQGGAIVTPREDDPSIVSYMVEPSIVWTHGQNHIFYYDENEKVKDIKPLRGARLYNNK